MKQSQTPTSRQSRREQAIKGLIDTRGYRESDRKMLEARPTSSLVKELHRHGQPKPSSGFAWA